MRILLNLKTYYNFQRELSKLTGIIALRSVNLNKLSKIVSLTILSLAQPFIWTFIFMNSIKGANH